MKRFFVVYFVIFQMISTTTFVFAQEPTISKDRLLSDAQMTNTRAMNKEELRAFLSRGALATYQTKNILGETKTATEIIYDAAIQFQLNPQFLLALLQREQSLVEDKTPSKNQLDWAMGYSVCDSCSKSEPGIQKFRGFGNQVHYAAARLRESYLSDLAMHGSTSSGIGPGIPTKIDGEIIIPANQATASLYTYTPHLHGNLNLVKIWNRWFSQKYPNESLLQDSNTGAIWLIQSDKKRLVTSKAVFYSRFNLSHVISVSTETLNTYPNGSPIRFPNYSLLRSPNGTVYLIVNDLRRAFTSDEALRVAGFSPDELIDVKFDDLLDYQTGEPISTNTIYAQGTLLQNKKTGGIFYVQDGQKHPIFSREILASRFSQPHILAVSPDRLEAYKTAEPLLFSDGSLIGVKGSSEVFVIENGLRRPISDEGTFLTFGFKWNRIAWTNERSVLLQPLGLPLSNILPKDDPDFYAVSIK